ncbi:MAG: acylase, partial [bacterium]|nr:acylase [bacterium]
RNFALFSVLCLWLGCGGGQQGTEILWDTWGVPHIFAEDNKGVFHAFGYAQARGHGNLILRLYGQARGQAAAYWGEEYLDSDRWVHTMDVPRLADEWARAQSPEMRIYLDAFAAGFNAYASEHLDQIADEVEVVLPVSVTDMLAHTLRVIHFSFVANPRRVAYWVERFEKPGSNTWAVAPSRSESGNAMLLMNPHLPWGDMMTWFEVQLTAPGLNAYGAALVGQPVVGIAFNDHLGWSHTVNTHDGQDLFELTLEGEGYMWDGAVRPFETDERTLTVRQDGGGSREEKLVVRRSVHGPVVSQKDGKALALRVVGINETGLFEQYWDMLRATNLEQFEAAVRRMQMPMFTVMYADRDGHILHLFGGRTPIRATGDWSDWQRPAPGDTSKTMWNETHPYEDLPRVLDPPSGWLQNANDPPWTTTFPRVLDPNEFPPYMAPRSMSFRAQHSARLLATDDSISFDEFVEYKHSTRMELAERILDDLIAAARNNGDSAAARGAMILEQWDRKADADSRGAVLFEEFFRRWQSRAGGKGAFAVKWDPANPRSTPRGLASPATAVAALGAAVEAVEKEHGDAGAAWGDVYRLKIGSAELPANGGPG